MEKEEQILKTPVNQPMSQEDFDKMCPQTHITDNGETLYRLLYSDPDGTLHALYLSQNRLQELEDYVKQIQNNPKLPF